MYDIILTTHDLIRWVVLLAGLVAAIAAIVGWVRKKEWSALDNKLGLIYIISFDIQFVLGLLLYFWLSPITEAAFNDFGAAMGDANLRFFAVEHISVMIIALVLAHVGRAMSKRAEGNSKFKHAAIFYSISLILVLSRIPWFHH